MHDGSWKQARTIKDGEKLLTGMGLLATSEQMHGLEGEHGAHHMPDGSWMRDVEMAAWEHKHSPEPSMHLMEDGSWMKNEKMVHTMLDGTTMLDVDMKAWEAKHAPSPGMRMMHDGSWKE